MRFLLMLSFILGLSGCLASHKIPKSAIGKKLEQNLTLEDVNHQHHLLSSLAAEKKGLVIFFWQRLCPCVKRYERRIEKLVAKYGDDFTFINVSSNSNESFTEVIREYNHRRSSLALMRDEGAKLARALDVKGTPATALLSLDGSLLFLGWIDNERDSTEPARKAFLENALKQYLAEEPITQNRTAMFGCAIR